MAVSPDDPTYQDSAMGAAASDATGQNTPMAAAAPKPFVPDTSSPEAFTNSMYKRGLDLGMGDQQARLMAAQAALESNYGNSELATNHNNLFGMKAGNSWSGDTANMPTSEQSPDGSIYKTKADFRKYGSADEAISDYRKRLQKQWPDAATADNWDDAKAGLKFGQQGGYATDQNYGSKLDNVISKIDPNYTPGANPAGALGYKGPAPTPPTMPPALQAARQLAMGGNTASDASNTAPAQAATVPAPAAPPNTFQQNMGNIGNSLTNIGAALMARDNPSGAAALRAGLPPAQAKTNLTDSGHVKVGGQWFQKNFNPATGQSTMTPVAPDSADLQSEQKNAMDLALQKKKLEDALKPEDPEDSLLKAKPADVKLFQQNNEGMKTTANIIDDMHNFQNLVKDNDLQVNMLASGEAEVRNRLGVADQNSAALKDAQRLIHRIQYEYMKTEAGPATKQKIQQTKEIMFPAGGEYSSPTLLQAFGKAEQQMRDHYSALKDTNESYSSGYKGLPKTVTNKQGQSVDPSTFHQSNYDRWNDWDKNDLPKVNGYINNKLSGKPLTGAPKTNPFLP